MKVKRNNQSAHGERPALMFNNELLNVDKIIAVFEVMVSSLKHSSVHLPFKCLSLISSQLLVS